MIKFFDIGMIIRLSKNARNDAALLGHAHPLGCAKSLDVFLLSDVPASSAHGASLTSVRPGIYGYHIDGIGHVSIRSKKIAPEDKGGGRSAVACGIVISSARYFAKAGPVVKAQRRVIVFVDFQKDRARTETCQPAQVEIKQLSRKSSTALAAGNGNRKDFRLILDDPGHDETRKLSIYHRAVSDDVSVNQ